MSQMCQHYAICIVMLEALRVALRVCEHAPPHAHALTFNVFSNTAAIGPKNPPDLLPSCTASTALCDAGSEPIVAAASANVSDNDTA